LEALVEHVFEFAPGVRHGRGSDLLVLRPEYRSVLDPAPHVLPLARVFDAEPKAAILRDDQRLL
jgi:hypothetical protein